MLNGDCIFAEPFLWIQRGQYRDGVYDKRPYVCRIHKPADMGNHRKRDEHSHIQLFLHGAVQDAAGK